MTRPPPGGSFAALRQWVEHRAASMELIEALQHDQIERSLNGQLLFAEAYFDLRPDLADMPEALDLVIGELNLRFENGDAPVLSEYVARFPRWQMELEQWFQMSPAFLGTSSEEHEAAGASDVVRLDRDRTRAAPIAPLAPGRNSAALVLVVLLRRRLRAVAWIFGAFSAGYVGLVLFYLRTGDSIGTYGWTGILLSGATAVGSLAIARLLQRHEWNLTALRRLELALFGLAAMFFGGLRYLSMTRLVVADYLGPAHAELAFEMEMVRNNMAWFSILVIYGVAIPNTGRRCLCVIGALAAMPLVIQIVAGSAAGVLWSKLAYLTVATAMVEAVAGGIGVFGAERLSAMQRAVQAARAEARELGQYRLVRPLGVGGMGQVYLAEHRLFKRPCAIKLIHSRRADDPRAAARFEREIQATAQLTHPCTVRVYDFGRDDEGRLYYVMEYLDGVTLDELVRADGPIEPERAIHFLRQLCGSLTEAHSAGLVHRDLKPGNIMICRQGGQDDVVKLLDFGLVSLCKPEEADGRLTQEGQFFGTPEFIAPEQIESPDRADGRSDIYSLGAIGFFLLTGRPPFVRPTVIRTLLAHVHDTAPSVLDACPSAPPRLVAVLERCLAKEPNDRFENIRAVHSALAEGESRPADASFQ